ncbi:M20/M25/M40 family metallo-hydrolase [Mangrovimicrobium sediminis]|uniref:M20/M25/M40 family metallo-hydrolase n=1 Tax=Mangrovimicrobium sediminis TaxID=2562682 RepID=A0A4Z0LWT5_9GAMM|nr:M20/M25/M40 family metallo-hydrolase [Haliea sp. SAOS-164]TGD71739.1 M20/M25/M40 family metallo-hydrolase [Haliea sp. SAOS-164]
MPGFPLHRHALRALFLSFTIPPALSLAMSCALPLALNFALAAVLAAPTAAAALTFTPHIDRDALLTDIRTLADDRMEGREMGTRGNALAQDYIERALADSGLAAVGRGWRHPFACRQRQRELDCANLLGTLPGSSPETIVVSAHFDHLGVGDGDIYNGADDNASGVAAVLALVRALRDWTPRHTIVFAFFDAEEFEHQGATWLLADPALARSDIRLNINLDMLSRSERGELYVAGTHHYPGLLPLVQAPASSAPVTLLAGHDRPELGEDDWTAGSDHHAFHLRGIPFLYFGVEDHPDYHQPSDEFARINPDFYVDAVRTVAAALLAADAFLPPGGLPH